MDEAYLSKLAAQPCGKTMAALARLCTHASEPSNLDDFHDMCQAHLIVTDRDSEAAATWMLREFGNDVTEATVAMGCHLYLWFQNRHRANLAISYYNRMPRRMTNFNGAKAQALLRRLASVQDG